MTATDTRTPPARLRTRQFGLVGGRRSRIILVVIAVLVANLLVVGVFLGGAGPDADAVDGPSLVDAPELVVPPIDRWIVDLSDSGFALRARAGECAVPTGTLEQSSDAGLTWSPVPRLNLAVVYAVQAGGPGLPMIVGATADCQVRKWQSEDGGQSWAEVRDVPGLWFRDPGAPATVVSPDGGTSAPCGPGATVLDVRTSSDGSGVVSCSDGLIARSSDGGGRWEEFGRLPGLTSATVAGGVGHAVSAGPECTGAVVSRGETGGWTELACVPGADPPGASASLSGGTGLLVSYNGTWQTSDGGVTWTLLPT